jgi:UTP--glucose-1-phosphate uridylyltransferase
MTQPVTKAVFPAAGLGTRFLPITKALPKEMLPIVDKPLIQYAVEEAVHSGIQNIYIVTGRGKSAIEDYFDLNYELEHRLSERQKTDLLAKVHEVMAETVDVAYVRQKEALGLGHAVLRAKALVGAEPFAVVLSDDVIRTVSPVRPCLQQLLDVYSKFQAPVLALQPVDPSEAEQYGIATGELVQDEGFAGPVYRVRDLVEKPRPGQVKSTLAIIGRYVLTPDIFGILQHAKPGTGGEIQLTDALKRMLRRRPIYGICFEGKRYDAGDKFGLLTATLEFALENKEIGPRLRKYLRANLDRITTEPSGLLRRIAKRKEQAAGPRQSRASVPENPRRTPTIRRDWRPRKRL